jgi:hypothetical protein
VRALAASDFFSALPLAVAPRLPIELRGFETVGGRGRLLKFHYGRSQVHFEAWHHAAAGKLELGLHFEGTPALNTAALNYFRERMVEIKAGLPRAELEPWDRGWSRLYETLPAPVLDDVVLATAGARLAAYMTTLQPLLEAFLETEGG